MYTVSIETAKGQRLMSAKLSEIVNSYSDLLIAVLDTPVSDQLLIKVLVSVEQTHYLIDQGLLR